MKKILYIIIISISAISFAQTTVCIDTDTIKGADTLTFTTNRLKIPNGFVGLEATYIEITGSSSNDYMVAQASQSGYTDGYATLTTIDNNVYTAGNDTIILSGNKVGLWGVSMLPFDYFQIKMFGVAGDTGICRVCYVAKRY